ncbi:PRC-barrel domain-containing protein [Rhodoblastus sp.]|uniref:PRC-barrel domain-containing protein n=1 Tax=Rhodoblastus sp. TaxID=1962975 RepID=UPI003F9C8FB2
MKKAIGLMLVSMSTTMVMTAGARAAPIRPMPSIPADSVTVTDWYKQDVYDPNNSKLGQVKDVLIDKSGKARAVIVGVGGLLGADEKDVAVPFEAIQIKNNGNEKWRLVMDSTVDALKGGATYTYDRQKTTWVPAPR